jgi:hypothetical protein
MRKSKEWVQRVCAYAIDFMKASSDESGVSLFMLGDPLATLVRTSHLGI